MYRFLKRVKNSIKDSLKKTESTSHNQSTQSSEINPELINAITVFSSRIENRNISSLEQKENNVQ